MKKIYMIAGLLLLAACSKENLDVVTPTSPDKLPIQIILDSDEDGNVEDDDKAEVVFTFADRIDPTGESLSGITPTLPQDATVRFKVDDLEGFSVISDYIKDAKAWYEIDDCTTSEDLGDGLDFTFDPLTGEGSFTFRKEVEEVVVEFELDDSYFDDNSINEDRGFKVKVVALEGIDPAIAVINTDVEFEYKVLDDELIFGEYELVLDSTGNFDRLKELFGALNEDVLATNEADVDAVEVEFSLEDFELKLVLKQTETIVECGVSEEVNIEYELEGGLEELTDDSENGDLEFVIEVENDKGGISEYTYKGTFAISGDLLTLELESEDAGVESLILYFSK